jgi:sarcosine oxidase
VVAHSEAVRRAFPGESLAVDEGRCYGFPEFGVPGFKVGRYHHRCQTADPDRMDRQCHAEDEAVLREFVEKYFPEGTTGGANERGGETEQR